MKLNKAQEKEIEKIDTNLIACCLYALASIFFFLKFSGFLMKYFFPISLFIIALVYGIRGFKQ